MSPAKPALVPVSSAAVKWLANGQRGTSSETIFTHLTGIVATSGYESHPHDPADLGRCRRLLEQVPELRHAFSRMRDVSPIWSRLVDEWGLLSEMMDLEAPDWRKGRGTCPKTYNRMKQIGC
ncbi:hypothetical protein AB7849_09505 [Rhodanobacter sp. 115]|uniref:hypothetical protein n=1 Tax=Rhodanobacter sp. FW021-MT20 TaxID=1162282 RepID=UPI0034E4E8FF